MRLAGVLLAVVLATSTAYADPLPFDIVRMLPETNQVLVLDRTHNKHVLLEPGSTFGDYTVVSVSSLDMVVEKQHERFAVYPKDAKLLSLTVYKGVEPNPQPPVIFSKTTPASPAQVADGSKVDRKKTNDKTQAAEGLAMVVADQPVRPRATLSSKLSTPAPAPILPQKR